jgi:hypothetical protein
MAFRIFHHSRHRLERLYKPGCPSSKPYHSFYDEYTCVDRDQQAPHSRDGGAGDARESHRRPWEGGRERRACERIARLCQGRLVRPHSRRPGPLQCPHHPITRSDYQRLAHMDRPRLRHPPPDTTTRLTLRLLPHHIFHRYVHVVPPHALCFSSIATQVYHALRSCAFRNSSPLNSSKMNSRRIWICMHSWHPARRSRRADSRLRRMRSVGLRISARWLYRLACCRHLRLRAHVLLRKLDLVL